MKTKIIGIIAGFLSAVGYGAYSITTNMLMQYDISNNMILCLRMTLAASLLWICYALSKNKTKAALSDIVKLMLVGGCVYASMSALILYSIRLIPTSLPLVILCTYPIFVAIYSVFAGKTKFTFIIPTAFVMAMVGLWWTMNIHETHANIKGVLVGFAAALAYSFYVILGSKVNAEIHPFERAAALMTGAAITYTVIGAVRGGLTFNFESGAWFWVAVIVILCTVLPVYLFWVSAEKAGVMEASTLGLLEPVSNILFFVIIFGEVIVGIQIIGIILTITGIFLIQLPPDVLKRKKKKIEQ